MKTILQVLISINLLTAAGAWAQNSNSSRGYSSSPAPPQPSSVSVQTTRPVQTTRTIQAPSYARSAGVYGDNSSTLSDLIGTFQRGPSAVFVVPAADASLTDLLTVNEDLTVMARILNRALQQANLGGQDGNPFSYSFAMSFPGAGTQMAPNLYLEGYGALFTLSVDFPLSPVATNDETAPAEQTTDTDPVWQEMRQDLFEPQQPGRQVDPMDSQMQQYSPQKVETLKAALIGALKHAANIRALKPDEAMVVTVMGPTVPGQLHSIKSIPGTDEFEIVDDRGPRRISKDRLAELPQLTAPTILMVRAKAADIGAFAQGQLNLDQFRQRVNVVTYPHLGRMVNSGSDTSIFLGGRAIRGRGRR